jgi:hypothetical protein
MYYLIHAILLGRRVFSRGWRWGWKREATCWIDIGELDEGAKEAYLVLSVFRSKT